MKLIKSKVFILFILILVSSLVIFFKFNLIPRNITFDEVDFAKLALSLDGKPYTPYSNLATGHSTLYFYILLVSFKLFGVGNFALRFPAALFGVLGVIMFYLLMERVFNKNHFIVFLTTLIFATSRWYFNFARFSFEATFLLFLELTSLYFLLRSNKPSISSIVSGIFAGLAFNSYTPGRFFFVIPLFYMVTLYFRKRKELVKNLVYFIVPFLIVIAPLTTYLLTHQDNRVDKLFFWKNHEMTLSEKVNGTLQNIYTVSSMFVYQGDMSGKHNYPGKPALNPLIGLLFIAGIFLALRRFKDTNNRLFLAFLFISMLPSFMIYPWENPNMLRTFTAITGVVYLVGLTLSKILENKKYMTLAMVLSFILILSSSIYELRTYFVYQAKVFPSAFETKPTLEESLKHINFKYGESNK